MDTDICLTVGAHLFNLRVAALVVRDGRVLTCRFADERHSFLPGGRVGAGEPTRDALRRELAEELGVQCEVGRPVFLVEGFFTLDGRAFHEIALYYVAEVPEQVPSSFEDGGRTISFEWVPLAELHARNLQPALLRERLADLPSELTHLVNVE
ncbi:MAG: NUDIX domain-containing protein [Deltaproteobacteria bacterium]|nr:NUDIX domain-containing protein [Deltaproteobacteria bacterium]